MIKHFCDRCKAEIAEPCALIDGNGVYSAVDAKEVCKSCWDLWKETVYRFFQRQGQ